MTKVQQRIVYFLKNVEFIDNYEIRHATHRYFFPLFTLSLKFFVTHALISHEQIMHGGPPRDGIPSIDQPRFVKPDEAAFLRDKDKVLGVVINGVAKAYPIRILNWHAFHPDTEVFDAKTYHKAN